MRNLYHKFKKHESLFFGIILGIMLGMIISAQIGALHSIKQAMAIGAYRTFETQNADLRDKLSHCMGANTYKSPYAPNKD